MPTPKIKVAPVNANNLTKQIISYLNYTSKYFVWRNNTVGVFDPTKKIYRKNAQQLRGISDILGVQKGTGRIVCIEIKVGKDVLSPYQIQFLEQMKQNGAIVIVAHNFDQFLEEMKKY